MKIIVHTEYTLPENAFERAEWLDWYTKEVLSKSVNEDEVNKFKKSGYCVLENKDPTSNTTAKTTYHLSKEDEQ